MSNKRKLRGKDGKRKSANVIARGLANILNPGSDHRQFEPLTHEEMITTVGMPASESEVIKIVPAKVDGIRVGDAYIHDDGQVSIKFDEDAPKKQMDKIKATGEAIGYDIETGLRTNGSS